MDKKIDRCEFFKMMAGEFFVFFDELRGKPQLRLSDLWELPRETLAKIKPMLLADIEIIVSEKHIIARRHGEDKVIGLVDREPRDIFVINQINGQKTIGQIKSELVADMSLNEEEAFTHVRDLFLKLVRLGICVPRNSVEV